MKFTLSTVAAHVTSRACNKPELKSDKMKHDKIALALALLNLAIVGGAVFPPLQGVIADTAEPVFHTLFQLSSSSL